MISDLLVSCNAFTAAGGLCAAKGRRALWSDGVRYTVCTRHANAAHAGEIVRFPSSAQLHSAGDAR